MPEPIDDLLTQAPENTLIISTPSGLITHLPMSGDHWRAGWGYGEEVLKSMVRQTEEDEKSAVAKDMLSALMRLCHEQQDVIFNLFGKNTVRGDNYGITTSLYKFNFNHLLHTIVQEAAKLDKEKTQQQLAYHTTNENPSAAFVANYCLTFAEMATQDQEISEGGAFTYFGKTIKLNPKPMGAAKAREILCGHAVLIEDTSGKPLGIAPIHETTNKSTDSEEVGTMSAEEFAAREYYGKPTPLEDVKACLDDKEFTTFLNTYLAAHINIQQEINPHVLPLFARVRLHKLFNSEKQPLVQKIIEIYGRQSLSVFQLLEGNNLSQALEMCNYLYEAGQGALASILLNAADITSEVDALRLVEKNTTEKQQPLVLFEKKMTRILQEAAELVALRGDAIDYADIEIIIFSMSALRRSLEGSMALKNGEKIAFPEVETMPYDFIFQLLEFAGKYPEAKEIFSTFFDFASTVIIARQKNDPALIDYPQHKAEFYRAYTEMNRNSETTNSKLDLARGKSSIIGLYRQGLQPQGSRVLFAGCGNCQRYEGPLLSMLSQEGIEFEDKLGMDLVDYENEIPPEHHIRFKKGNLITENMSAEGKFDYIFFPWSVINDILAKEDLLSVLQRLKKLLNKGGVLILDVPLPIGTHSYAKILEEQRGTYGSHSTMMREFPTSGEPLVSLFNIMPLEEMYYDALNAGFVPQNWPTNSAERAKMYREVEENDSVLIDNHTDGRDTDVFKCPMWNGNGYNRATLVLKYEGEEEIEQKYEVLPSFLVNALFGRDNQK